MPALNWLSRLRSNDRLTPAERERLRGSVDPLGPIFISYRQADGTKAATELAWQLRAVGLPVWLDADDLPPGETKIRLQQALSEGLSGGILLITPDIANSPVVRRVELPCLLALQESSRFSFAVANTIRGTTDPTKPDLGVPNRLLGRSEPPLSEIFQYPLLAEGDAGHIAKALALRRMAVVRVGRHPELVIDIATRVAARAFSHESLPGLVIRTEPPAPGRRVMDAKAWQALEAAVAALPSLIAEASVSAVRVRGNAHLTVGFALGSALPAAMPWSMSVEPKLGEQWLDVAGGDATVDVTTEERDPGGQVAVLVDCVEHPLVSDTFADLVDGLDVAISGVVRLVIRRHLAPGEGAAVADRLAAEIRNAAARFGSPTVHLALRAPLPVALMLGRRLNTLEVHLYEWEDGISPARYVRMAAVSAGRGPVLTVNFEPNQEV